MLMQTRAQWPHTVEDIIKALDGIWGVVGAKGDNGNLYRLERSLKEPTVYTLIEHRGEDEGDILRKQTYAVSDKQNAVEDFAKELGFKF